MIRRMAAGVPEILPDDVYTAGQTVPPGRYRRVGASCEVVMEREDLLPASCDGTVALYVRQPLTWADIRRARETRPARA